MQLAAEDFFEQNTIPDMELKRFEDFFSFFFSRVDALSFLEALYHSVILLGAHRNEIRGGSCPR